MADTDVARHYARILLQVAADKGADREAIADGLARFAEALEVSAELRGALGSPALRRSRRAGAAVAALAHVAPDAAAEGSLLARFLEVMVSRERAGVIPETAAAFRALLDAEAGAFEAEVISARPLSREARAGLAAALGEALSGSARLTFREDPSLIGGFRVETGNRIYDASVSHKLARFAERHGGGAG